MAANDAFTAGVRPGGLTDSTEIRLLLCYLVKNAGPITRTEIENALMEEQLVNYFEIGSCLDDITRQQLVTLKEYRYSITEKGRKVAQELAYDLPRSVRERAVAAVLRSQTWARKEAEYSARITEKPDGHCSIRCTIKALDQEQWPSGFSVMRAAYWASLRAHVWLRSTAATARSRTLRGRSKASSCATLRPFSVME